MARIFALSDVHTDFKENMDWVRAIGPHHEDALLVAGDVSEHLELLRETLVLLRAKFKAVFFTPGNHDLWCDADEECSLDKLHAIMAMCTALDVQTRPAMFRGVLIAPLLAWHHVDWDTEPDVTALRLPAVADTCMDYRRCRFPPSLPCGSQALAQHFDALNQALPIPDADIDTLSVDRRPPVITFSHFLPRQDLLPEKRMLFYPHLPKMTGSLYLCRRVAAIRPDIHVFGHTHFGWDAMHDGTRFVQAPLCYPAERRRFSSVYLPLPVDTASSPAPAHVCTIAEREVSAPASAGAPAPLPSTPVRVTPFLVAGSPLAPVFSSRYTPSSPRTPADTAPAPWVVARFPLA